MLKAMHINLQEVQAVYVPKKRVFHSTFFQPSILLCQLTCVTKKEDTIMNLTPFMRFMGSKHNSGKNLLARPSTLSGSPVISDISLIRLSPHPAGPADLPFSHPHPYMNPHVEHYFRSMHSSPTLSMISAARGLSPADGASPADYYHQMTFMASHPNPYGDLLMQSGAAAGATHLHDYLSPVDGE
ncbi:hypothetical protein E2320_020428 [Naja naja]|nr:hypothetical protein E2320_020428 [Naja naja]